MKKDLTKLRECDKKKFLVYTRMNKLKVAMLIFLVLGLPLFVFGWVAKATVVLIIGAVFLTLFVIFEFLRESANSVWKKMLSEERKVAQEKEEKRKKKEELSGRK